MELADVAAFVRSADLASVWAAVRAVGLPNSAVR